MKTIGSITSVSYSAYQDLIMESHFFSTAIKEVLVSSIVGGNNFCPKLLLPQNEF